MALVNFTNLDFDQIKTSIRDYLRSNSNFTDFDYEGSNLSIIIDTLAYNTYITSYNANMISNEVFIDSATLRENVVSLARNIGYVPRSRTAARGLISFFVDVSANTPLPKSLTLKRGIVCTSASTFNGNSFSFSVPNDITVPVVNGLASFTDIEVYEGIYLVNNFTVTSNQPKQRFILPNANIDTDLINVFVKDSIQSTTYVKYNLSDTIYDIKPDSNVFFIQEIEDQRYELIFGDGVFGRKLEEGNFIEVEYVVTSGASANSVSQVNYAGRIVDNVNNLITEEITAITLDDAIRGGNEIESVESIRSYAPKIYASQYRAVTAGDYEALIPRIYPETQSVSVYGGETLNPPQYGKVFIAIKPFYGPFVPSTIKNNLKDSLRKYAVAGIVPEIVDIKYLYVELDTSIYYNSNLVSTGDVIQTVVNNNIRKYAESQEVNKYGSRIRYSKIQRIIDNSHPAITSNITILSMRRDLIVSIGSLASYELCFGNQIHVKNMNGGNIKSSLFTILNVSFGTGFTFYMKDIPDNESTGKIYAYNASDDKQYDEIGSIDYVRGEIMLNNIVITGTSKSVLGQPLIEISATPKSNDVIGLQDLYLQLDVSKSTFTPVVDKIYSGSDPSGSNYIVSSSYLNGNPYRK